MDQGTIDVSSLRESLLGDSRKAWMKLVLGPTQNDVAPVWAALVFIGPGPDNWTSRRWTYSECTFVSYESSAHDLASLFEARGPTIFSLPEDTVCFDFGNFTTVNWTRHPSRHKYDEIVLPWPSKSMKISFADQQLWPPAGYLVGPNSPSFPDFSGAFSAFFFERWVITGGMNSQLGQMTLRVVDERARITRVVVGPTSLKVWVNGSEIAGSLLELNSSSDRSELIVDDSGKLDFPLPDGLGQDPWIWLKNAEGYLDFRSLNVWSGMRSPDIEVEIPNDPVADIFALAAQGENEWLEYKRQLPDDSKDSKRKVFKTAVAFANGEGGTLLFGIDGDDEVGRVIGLDGDSAELQRRINDLMRSLVSPNPSYKVQASQIDDKCVIRLDIGSNQGMLHALVVDPNRPDYYVRRNGSTYFARPEELAALVRPSVQGSSSLDTLRIG